MQCDHTCTECGAQERGNWFDDIAKKLAEQKRCHSCDFWLGHVRDAAKPEVARIDGTHYRIGKENANPDGFRGFAGQRFKIKFSDGREVETTNLWCQGAIPERFRNRLPDNAQFER